MLYVVGRWQMCVVLCCFGVRRCGSLFVVVCCCLLLFVVWWLMFSRVMARCPSFVVCCLVFGFDVLVCWMCVRFCLLSDSCCCVMCCCSLFVVRCRCSFFFSLVYLGWLCVVG